MMSRENVEIVRRAFALFSEGGIEAVLPLATEDLAIYSMPDWPDDSEYHGHAGFRKLAKAWTENFDGFGFELRETRDAGDEVVALLAMTGQIKGSGDPVQQEIAGVFSDFRGGRFGHT